MDTRKAALLSIIVLALAGWLFFDLDQYLDLSSLKARQAALTAQVAASPWLAGGLFFLLYVLLTALSFPGAALLTLVAGALFGLLGGTLLVSLASTLGATLAMLSSRFLLRDWVQARFGPRLVGINQGLEREGAAYLFALRLVPLFPFFLVNLAMGLSRLPTRTYWWVSQVGMLPGTLVYVNAGRELGQLDSLGGILAPDLLGAFALLGVLPLVTRTLLARFKARKAYAGWRKPKVFERNLVVIGAGSGGLVSAYIAAAVKAEVSLIEKHKMGGDCLNTGCVPSKALLAAARRALALPQVDPALAADLRDREAYLLERRLDDASGALTAFRALLAADPSAKIMATTRSAMSCCVMRSGSTSTPPSSCASLRSSRAMRW